MHTRRIRAGRIVVLAAAVAAFAAGAVGATPFSGASPAPDVLICPSDSTSCRVYG